MAKESTYFKGINRACHSHGIYLTLLLRLSTVLPYFLVSYTLSVTDIRFSHYMMGNIGFFVTSTLYIYLGASAKEILNLINSENEVHDLKVAFMVGGACALFLVLSILAWLTKRELDRMIKEEEE
jgi:uncharacterized membrane protein YdjX (TVP38/TMEM64 family)